MRAIILMFVVLGVFCTQAVHATGVYKWTDADGRVHFGDSPPGETNAQEIKIQTFDGLAEVSGVSGDTVDRSVTVFSAVWCGMCQKAKQHLKSRGVSFTEYDIEKSGIGKSEFKRLGGSGVPVILVGAQRMNGFNPAKLDKMLKDVGLLKGD